MLHTLQLLYICNLCHYTGLFEIIVAVLTTCHTLEIAVYDFFYLIEQHSKFLSQTLQVLCMCNLCHSTGLYEMIVGVLTRCHTQYTWDSSICMFFYLIEQHSKFLLHTLQVFYMCTLFDSTGLFEIIVGVLTTCHTQYTWDRSVCIFLFNTTTLQVFVTYITRALYVHPLWFYRVIRNDCRGFNNLSYAIHLR